jgi:hypothetical protein
VLLFFLPVPALKGRPKFRRRYCGEFTVGRVATDEFSPAFKAANVTVKIKSVA